MPPLSSDLRSRLLCPEVARARERENKPSFLKMLRSIVNSCLKVGGIVSSLPNVGVVSYTNLIKPQVSRCFSAIVSQRSFDSHNKNDLSKIPASISKQQLISPMILQQQSRTVVKFSWKGKRRTVRVVPAKFYRLDWGMWIRRIAGAHKRRWKKNNKRLMRLERHVMVNATRSYMLDKMVTKYWRSPKYWVDDPYEPYHKREDFLDTRTKPRPLPFGVTFTDGKVQI